MPSDDDTSKPPIDTIFRKLETDIQTVPSPHYRLSILEATTRTYHAQITEKRIGEVPSLTLQGCY